jgi:hypothetical protein
MANAIYPIFKQALMQGGVDKTLCSLDQDNTTHGPYVALVDTGAYTYSSTHDFWDDASAAAIGGTAGQRIVAPNLTSTVGVFDGNDVTFSTVTGVNAEALVIYRHNAGAASTWRLVAYLDSQVTGLPVLPNGGDITITWASGGIFGL